MRAEFTDMQELSNPLNGQFFSNPQELAILFEQLRQRKPFGFELAGENGFTLTICLAQAFGSVQHATSDGDPPYLLAVAPSSPSLDGMSGKTVHYRAFQADEANGVQSPKFLVGGTPTPVPTRYCLPYDLVRKIADYFVLTGEREPSFIWENV